jgi:hypothetical protein
MQSRHLMRRARREMTKTFQASLYVQAQEHL